MACCKGFLAISECFAISFWLSVLYMLLAKRRLSLYNSVLSSSQFQYKLAVQQRE